MCDTATFQNRCYLSGAEVASMMRFGSQNGWRRGRQAFSQVGAEVASWARNVSGTRAARPANRNRRTTKLRFSNNKFRVPVDSYIITQSDCRISIAALSGVHFVTDKFHIIVQNLKNSIRILNIHIKFNRFFLNFIHLRPFLNNSMHLHTLPSTPIECHAFPHIRNEQ